MQGRLRISLPVLFGQRCVAPILFPLSQRYPELKLELSFSDRQVNLFEEGFDMAIRIGALSDSSFLKARRLGQHGMILCASPLYLHINQRRRRRKNCTSILPSAISTPGRCRNGICAIRRERRSRFALSPDWRWMISPPLPRRQKAGWESPGCRIGWWRTR